MKQIRIRGARTHNLKNLNVNFPRDKFIVITGLSGSGKSSLAFDTLYAEGQRRYVESLSSYARQFLSMMEKPDVDHIEGLSPAISIEQKSTSHNPRSTVGTITEIHDYLRLLFAKVGQPRCPKHGNTLEAQTISQMVDTVLAMPVDTKVMILSPVVRERKGEHIELLQELRGQGFVRARIDGEIVELDQPPTLNLRKKHTIEVVIDRIKIHEDLRLRIAESFETALRLADGIAAMGLMDEPKKSLHVFSSKFSCPDCGYNLPELSPRLFSFNSPVGACAECDGLGIKEIFDRELVVNQKLSLADGAIRGWDKRNFYYYQMLASLAKHYKFDLEIPFARLPKKIQTILLHGNNESIRFHYKNEDGSSFTKNSVFEGILPNLERRYRETESEFVREELRKYIAARTCENCEGARLNQSARNVFITNKTLPEIASWAVDKTKAFFEKLHLPGYRGEIAIKIIKELTSRLSFLVDVGLDYISLDRSAETLSGGEAQRIRLASQIGSGLVGVMYILDEPSIGLHQRDNERLLRTLHHLRDLGNTVIVVEHDEDAIINADYVLDLGPGAGVHGGYIVAQGKPSEIMRESKSLTGQYLSGKRKIEIPLKRVSVNPEKLIKLSGLTGNNLKSINVEIPIGLMTCITGVSGSGKSTLVNDTLAPVASRMLNGASGREPTSHESIEGLEYLDKTVVVDQSPIGRTPRSNPATYTGLFTAIRDLFAGTQESRSRGYQPGRFSFNVKGGRCEACQGEGVIKVEMHFLADVYVTCDICQGKRYNRETLEILYKGRNIHQILEMTVEEARSFFDAIPMVTRKLQTLLDVGLSYISLGQSATTLSGGEAQRIKLAKELSRRDTGRVLYLLDEPTTGLHFYDIEQLLRVLHRLRDQGNTIVVIEHNLDVIKTADWVIDLGPEGGEKGGRVVVAGSPEIIAKHAESYTGAFLRKVMSQKR
ncbi:MAG: excinuclease ABC subunit UvrA [Gammaproteobacteria bacterium]|nr:excinuclease ABC subunit UvrA [Gammaproteobacteria bacterium]MCW5583446.1 excinuclease ABC subunit UvrA [Gammaproteobacteria bacterium]